MSFGLTKGGALRTKGKPCQDKPTHRRRKRKHPKKATKHALGMVEDAMLQRLYVANLSFDSTEDMIREFFSDIGTITIIKMPTHRCKESCYAVMLSEAKQRLLAKGLRRKPKPSEVEPCPRNGRFQGFAFITIGKLKNGLTLEQAAEIKCGIIFRGRVLHVAVADPPRAMTCNTEEKISN